jgi:ubiquinone/menaquinone biosynthesis C-methylase UbiE
MAKSVASLEFSSFAEAYEKLLVGPLFRPWAELVIQRVAPAEGDRVLDVACGTGIVARLARERVGDLGRVVGVDNSAPMLTVARSIDPRIDWREGSAVTLPLGQRERFDIVTCHQGLQFFPDRRLAAREMRRALRPGGSLVVATWRPVHEMPLLVELQSVVERHVGPVVDTRHSFGDDRALDTLLTDAGFPDVRVEALVLPIRFADWTTFVRLNALALVGMSAASKQMDDAKRAETVAAVVAESEAVLPPFLDGQQLTFDLGSNVATARG